MCSVSSDRISNPVSGRPPAGRLARQRRSVANQFCCGCADPTTKKVTTKKEKDLAAARVAAARERRAEEAEASKPAAQAMVEGVSRLVATAFFFSQGILAGISMLLLMMILFDSADTVSFLHFFSPISRYVHGLLFWLTAACLLGSVDKLGKDKICGWKGGLDSVSVNAVWLRDLAVLSLYGMSLILTFINAEVDLRFQFSESRAPSWYRETSAPTAFKEQMSTWHALNALRLLLLIAAWVTLLTDSQVHVLGRPVEEVLQDEIALGEEAGGVPAPPATSMHTTGLVAGVGARARSKRAGGRGPKGTNAA